MVPIQPDLEAAMRGRVGIQEQLYDTDSALTLVFQPRGCRCVHRRFNVFHSMETLLTFIVVVGDISVNIDRTSKSYRQSCS